MYTHNVRIQSFGADSSRYIQKESGCKEMWRKAWNRTVICSTHTYTYAERFYCTRTHTKYRKRETTMAKRRHPYNCSHTRSRFCDICLTICWGRELSLARVWYCIHSRIWTVIEFEHTRTHTGKRSGISFHVLSTFRSHFVHLCRCALAILHSHTTIQSICFSIPMRWNTKSSIAP